MQATRLEIHPIAGALGAEIHGVDLGRHPDDATIADIRKALLDYCVVFFRDQSLKHLAVNDAGPYRRVMRRVQIAGDRPV